MLKKKISLISLGSIALIGGITFGVITTSAVANNNEQKIHKNVILEEVPSVKTVSFLEANTIEAITDPVEPIPATSSYVNYNKEKITEVIRMYAILENCQFQNAQKDEFIYYLSEYVTSAVQAEKYTTQDLKEQYISFAQSFHPPHPTQEDCIDVYNDAKETVNYWNEKKNTAFNELFSAAKNRYSPDPDENIDVLQEVIELPSSNAVNTATTLSVSDNNFYSLAGHAKKLPWNIKTTEIFNSIPLEEKLNTQPSETNIETEPVSEIIPDKKQNVNKIAIIDQKPFDANVTVNIEPSTQEKK